MSSRFTISLQSAILMNLNIMAGAGIFVNIVDLTKHLGLCAGFLYLAVGLFMFPLVFTFAKLVEMFPSGAFYAFAKPVSPLLAFVSTWTYFFGKLASATFLIHVAASFFKQLFAHALADVNILILDTIILALFILLNLMNLRIGILIQRLFFATKFIPLVFLIALGVYVTDVNILDQFACDNFYNFIIMLPLVLYCFSGFEAACSLSGKIENPAVNAPRAIFYSFFSIILVYFAFQTLIAAMLQPIIGSSESYVQAYSFLMQLLPCSVLLQTKMATIISFMIGFSALGAAYGLLFSNAWNLYTLAEHGHVFGSSQIKKLSKHGFSTTAILIEGVICLFFIMLSQGAKIPLQQTATFGCTVTYLISCVMYAFFHQPGSLLGYASLITCAGFLTACLMSAMQYSFMSLYIFGIMLFVGLMMFFIKKVK